MIKLDNISKSYGEINIVKNFNLEVLPGEIVVIFGSSGCGKTTILNISGLVLPPDSGSVYINGILANQSNITKIRLHHIGYIFQNHNLLMDFSAIENVSIPAMITGQNTKDIKKNALLLLKKVGLEDKINSKPSELSGGQCQRVAIARALINNPDVILADEPTGNLDNGTAKPIINLLHSFAKDGKKAVIIVTHNKEIADIATRVITLS